MTTKSEWKKIHVASLNFRKSWFDIVFTVKGGGGAVCEWVCVLLVMMVVVPT